MKNLKTLREAAGLSQAAVARSLGTTQQTYQRWESGKARPSIDTLQSLAMLLKVPLSRIIESPEGRSLGFGPNLYIITGDETGFWGHLGIQLPSKSTSLWFPVSAREQHRLHGLLSEDQPTSIVGSATLNNRYLMFATNRISRVRLLDEAGSEPSDDPDMLADDHFPLDDANGLPSVMYQALTEYLEDSDKESLTAMAATHIKECGISADALSDAIFAVKIHLIDGTVIAVTPSDDSLFELLTEYDDFDGGMLRVEDDDGLSEFIPKDRIALIDAPLNGFREAERGRDEDSEIEDSNVFAITPDVMTEQ